MFEIKDYIIITLVVLLGYFIYKYYNYSNQSKNLNLQIKDLTTQINLLKNTINNNVSIIDTNLLSKSSESYDSDSSDRSNNSDEYKSNQLIETFNNSNIICNNSICSKKLNNNDENLIKSDIYIPIDLKSIISHIYDITLQNNENDDDNDDNDDNDYNDNNYTRVEIIESSSTKNSNINQTILESENVLTNLKLASVIVPDFINLNNEQKAEDNEQKAEDNEQKAEDNKQKAEDNEQKAEDNEQKAEDNEQKAEDNEQKAEDNEQKLINDLQVEQKLINDLQVNKIELETDVCVIHHNESNYTIEDNTNNKYTSMKISEIKNLARSLNIKITDNGKPKNRETLINEINIKQNNSIII